MAEETQSLCNNIVHGANIVNTLPNIEGPIITRKTFTLTLASSATQVSAKHNLDLVNMSAFSSYLITADGKYNFPHSPNSMYNFDVWLDATNIYAIGNGSGTFNRQCIVTIFI